MNKIEIAKELLAALDHGRTIPSVAARQPGFDWEQGYDIAAEIVKLRRARGETPVGRKIGFTNRNIWPEYGATSPIWAHVYDDTLIFAEDNVATVSLAGSARPKLEPEIAFKLRAPLPVGCRDPALILDAVKKRHDHGPRYRRQRARSSGVGAGVSCRHRRAPAAILAARGR